MCVQKLSSGVAHLFLRINELENKLYTANVNMGEMELVLAQQDRQLQEANKNRITNQSNIDANNLYGHIT